MSDHYKFHIDYIQEMAQFSEFTVKELQDVLKMAESLKKKVESYSGWKGKQREELITFLDLLIAYHKDLVQKDSCPFIKYQDSLKLLNDNLDRYIGRSKSYRELKSK